MAAVRALALVALAAVSSAEATDCSYAGLMDHLGLTSNSTLSLARPVRRWTTATPVFVDMLLSGILEVDEKFQTVISHISIYTMWESELLTWNSSEFCGIDLLPVPLSLLWAPDIFIKEDISDTSSSYKSPLAILSSNGEVHASSRQLLTSTCKLDLKSFPFDVQKCNITFGSMSCSDDMIRMQDSNDSKIFRMSRQTGVTHGEWALLNISSRLENETNGGYRQTRLVYTIKILRKPLLYVVNFIVPLFYLLVLDLASFFISNARGEKLGFKITVLLSISVLLLILKDILPSTEDNLPMIANFCVATFALVGLSVLEAMVVSFLCDLDDWHPRKPRRRADNTVEVELEVGSHDGNEEEAEAKPEKGSCAQDQGSTIKLLNEILREVKTARQEIDREATKELSFFKRVAQILDASFFILYLLTVVVFLLYMYVTWFHEGITNGSQVIPDTFNNVYNGSEP